MNHQRVEIERSFFLFWNKSSNKNTSAFKYKGDLLEGMTEYSFENLESKTAKIL